MGRAPCCDKTKVKRGPWSPEEDNTLRNYVENHGTGGSWIALPQKAGLKRCGKSCRLRWLNYLRPNIKHGGFTHEEDTIILTLYHNIGSRWSVIASQLPGRTDNDVKNYWNTKLKKKLLVAATSTTTSTSTSSSSTAASSLISTTSMVETAYNTLPYVNEALDDQILFENAYLSSPFAANGGGAASWNQNGSGGDDAFLVEFGSGLMAYDVMNVVDFHENFNHQISYGYSPL